MRYAVIIIMLGFCLFRADAQDQPSKQEVQVSEEVAKRCKEEGGCILISQRRFEYFLNKAMREAFLMGVKHGTEQACRRKDI